MKAERDAWKETRAAHAPDGYSAYYKNVSRTTGREAGRPDKKRGARTLGEKPDPPQRYKPADPKQAEKPARLPVVWFVFFFCCL